jgi:hypothetical protein
MKNRVPNETSAPQSPKHFRLPRGSAALGIAVVALLALSGVAAACGGGGGGGGGNGGGLTQNCSIAGAVDALEIPLGLPQTTAPAGSTISASYEVEIVGYTSADSGALIHFPSVYVKIPLNATTKLAFTFAPTNVTITAAGWSSPVTMTTTLGSSSNFNAGVGNATLSTVSIAVMAKDHVGNLTVAIQWGWSLTVGATTTSLWSTASSTATLPALPTIFQAAPYVSLDETTNTTAARAGSDFEAALDGAVGKTSFGVSVEYPNGMEIVCKEQNNPWPSNCLIVDVPLTYLNSTPLAAGNYIVHIHDSMGAIVHTISVTVVNSTSWGWHHGGTQGLNCGCHQSGGGGGNGGNGGGNGGWDRFGSPTNPAQGARGTR